MTHAAVTASPTPTAQAALPEPVLQAVGEALAGLRFGTIQLTVHEGRVVQLEVTEKQRFV